MRAVHSRPDRGACVLGGLARVFSIRVPSLLLVRVGDQPIGRALLLRGV
jgi:hypothetical protein